MRKLTLKNRRIVVIGGDGFIGWPLTVALRELDAEIIVIDNLLRRNFQQYTGSSLVSIQSATDRFKHLNVVHHQCDMSTEVGFDLLSDILKENSVDAIIHLGQIRSAPFSMIDTKSRLLTTNNNVSSCLNVLEAVRVCSPKTHMIHIGTMGVYGYSVSAIEEQESNKPVDYQPGSIYHLSKVFDQHMLKMYNKLYGIKVTELHQGIVWGSQTELTKSSMHLYNRYDYDHIYGTVVNRFMASVVNKQPMYVYGDGKHRRSFIHLEDSIECIKQAIIKGMQHTANEITIANQFSEILSINQVAMLVSAMEENADTVYIPNPRLESNSVNYDAGNNILKQRILTPGHSFTTMDSFALKLSEEMDFISNFKQNFDSTILFPTVKW
jgi:UDP-sulfoquinovose synthase